MLLPLARVRKHPTAVDGDHRPDPVPFPLERPGARRPRPAGRACLFPHRVVLEVPVEDFMAA